MRLVSIAARIADWQSFRNKDLPQPKSRSKQPWVHRAEHFIRPNAPGTNYEPEDLYHVTTNLAGVLRDQQLKSRVQVREEANRKDVPGLGGGSHDTGSAYISTTYNFEKALRIYTVLKVAGQAARNELTVPQIIEAMTRDTNKLTPTTPIKIGTQEMTWKAWQQYATKKFVTGPEKYDLVQYLDRIVGVFASERDYVGLLAPTIAMKRIDSANLAILKLAVRANAKVREGPDDAEMRFVPKDVRVVRYWQP